MSANISTGDWELATSRITQVERQLGLEQQDRGQLITALRQEFLTAQERWQAVSAALEELRAQMEAIRAAVPGSGIDRGGLAALLDPRYLDKPKAFHGKQTDWRDWSEAFTSFVEVVDPDLAQAMKRVENWTSVKLISFMDAKEVRHAKALFYLLVMLTKEEAAARRPPASIR